MKYLVITLFFLPLFNVVAQSSVTSREGEPDIYHLVSDDKEMNDAIIKAKSTFDDFLEIFENRKSNGYYYSIKMAFETEAEIEHIWLVDLKEKKKKLYGRIGNVPEYATHLVLNEEVEIDENWISDWFYIKDGKLVGGYTIRLIRNRMSVEEREQFDYQFGIEF